MHYFFVPEHAAENTCEPIHKLIFAKTHKTGSTTVHNIIFRYGMKNNLTFVFPKTVWWFFDHYSSFKAVRAIGYNNSSTKEDVGKKICRLQKKKTPILIPMAVPARSRSKTKSSKALTLITNLC